jgi:hypothetical protein
MGVIARDHDINETIKLLELVLYCTVKSERREEAVGNIMALEPTEQQMIMELINGTTSPVYHTITYQCWLDGE